MRLHVPFDTFGMREKVCVSSLVRDESLGWTCGQCPLDRDGNVIAPYDLLAQASIVCRMIEELVQRGRFDRTGIGKLNVYFNENVPAVGAAAIAMIGARFPQAIIVPTPVPEFYYAGMMIEVDVFAADRSRHTQKPTKQGILSVVETGHLTWAHVHMRLDPHEAVPDAMAGIDAALRAKNLSVNQLLSDQWSASRTLAAGIDLSAALTEFGFLTMADGIVIVDDCDQRVLSGDLAFSIGQTTASHTVDPDVGLQIAARNDGRLYWIQSTQSEKGSDLVSQTDAIMSGIAAELRAQELSFANVVKVTAHYVGEASAEDLHQNLEIRHSHYARPGPASTGLRVTSLLNPDALIAIAVIATR